MKHLKFFTILIVLCYSCKSNSFSKEKVYLNVMVKFENGNNKSQLLAYSRVVKNRIFYLYKTKPEIHLKDSIVSINVSSNLDTNLLKRILTTKGKFEMWETYDNREIFELMNQINTSLKQLNIMNRFVDDTSQISLTFPFFKKLEPLIDNQGNLIEGPFAGMALYKDKALIDSVLGLEYIRGNLYKNLIFKWYEKPEKGYYLLIPLKDNDTDYKIRNQDMIRDVHIETELDNGKYIIIQMRKEYYSKLRKLSEYNIGRAVAISIDEVVYSTVKQMDVIEDGNVKLTGNYTIDELNSIVAILKFGEIPSLPTGIDFKLIKN